MTLKQLEAFYWAATCSSFAIAADKLHISQSSLSKRIAELEASVGHVLFDRGRRRAVLTGQGLALLPRAKALLQHASEVASSFQNGSLIQGRCRFGVGEIAASSWLPKLVKHTRDRFPALALEPYIELGAALESDLVSGKLDAAMIARQTTHPSLESIFLANVRYVWVAARDAELSNRNVEDILRDFPVVTMSRDAGSTEIFTAWKSASGVSGVKLIECNSMVAMAGIIASGIAIGYLPRGWLQPLFRSGVLEIIDSHVALPDLEYRFYWRSDDSRPVIGKVREMVAEVVDYSTPLLMLRW